MRKSCPRYKSRTRQLYLTIVKVSALGMAHRRSGIHNCNDCNTYGIGITQWKTKKNRIFFALKTTANREDQVVDFIQAHVRGEGLKYIPL